MTPRISSFRAIGQHPSQRFAAGRRFWATIVSLGVVALVVSAAEQTACAQDEQQQRREGKLIRIPPNISSTVAERAIRQAKSFEARARDNGSQPVIIFEIEPGQSSFGASHDLAEAITELSAQTVAYIPNRQGGEPQTLRGHAVLVALACQRIAMSKDAEIGSAGIDESVINESMRLAYQEIADARRNVPAALAVGMLDEAKVVWEVELAGGREFLLEEELQEREQNQEVNRGDVPAIPRDEFGQFTGAWLQSKGVVQHLVESRNALADALALPMAALDEDIFMTEGMRAVQVAIEEPLTHRFVNQVQRSIERAIDEMDANLIILTINTSGGAPEASKNLANYIAKLPKDRRRTVAFVNRKAEGDGMFIAMACDHLLMAPDASIGGGIEGLDEPELNAIGQGLEDVSRATGRPHSVLMAMIDPEVTVFEYQNMADGRVSVFDELEKLRQNNPDQWQQGRAITAGNEALTLEATEARRLGVATDVVTDFEELKSVYGLETDPQSIQPNWLDTLLDALTQEGVLWALLLIGGSAFFVEMQSPGTGIGGFVACVCFLLFFWGNYLDGTAGWLEILLFIAGLIFVLLEVFVIPGMGIFGVGGGIMIVASLVMALQSISGDLGDRTQVKQLQNSLFLVTTAGVGIVVVFVLVRKYFPKTGRFGSFVLSPPQDAEQQELSERESVANYQHLIGESGIATTPLRPAGKVQIDGAVYDVVTDGLGVEKGDKVVIAKVQGSRIVVRSVANED